VRDDDGKTSKVFRWTIMLWVGDDTSLWDDVCSEVSFGGISGEDHERAIY
jgi:hypothetical protein